jgi:hypothetical protein
MVVCQVGLWVMSVKGQVGGERGREKESGKKRFLKEHLLLPLLHVQGKEKKNNVVQNDTILCYLFFFEKKEMNLRIIKNWVMETIISLYFPERSLICAALKMFFKKSN